MINQHSTEYSVVCRTEGCHNENLAIVVIGPDTDPFMICGACSNKIDDVTLIVPPTE